MSIADKFSRFCSTLRMDDDMVSAVSYRYHRITQQLMNFFEERLMKMPIVSTLVRMAVVRLYILVMLTCYMRYHTMTI